MNISVATTVQTTFEEAVANVTEALQKEGFGILTTIDFQAKMKEKLGKEMGRYLILGACNPALAWDAVGAVPELGVLLPCNVIIRDAPAGIIVEAMEPKAALGLIPDETVHRIGAEASERLNRAIASL
ncbi:MAG: DUF302 domain-containing protein [Thermoplasmatota archaeon]